MFPPVAQQCRFSFPFAHGSDAFPGLERVYYITPCSFVPNATESQSSKVLKHLKSYYKLFPLWAIFYPYLVVNLPPAEAVGGSHGDDRDMFIPDAEEWAEQQRRVRPRHVPS